MSSDKKNIIELVKAVQAGDKNAFSEIYVILHKKVLNYCYFIIKDFHVAQELTNTIFLKIMNTIDDITPEKFIPYILKSARNNCLNYLQSAKKIKIPVVFTKKTKRVSILSPLK